MTQLESFENDKVSLEVFECDCGFHMGLDSSYLDQVGDIEIACPACQRVIKTEDLMSAPADDLPI